MILSDGKIVNDTDHHDRGLFTTAELIVILTSVSETIRKTPLAETQTALGKQNTSCRY